MGVGKQLVEAIAINQNDKVNKLLQRIGPEDVNDTDDDGWTPLHVACVMNNVIVAVKLLSVPGIQVNARSNIGKTAIILAATRNNIEALKLLLDHPDVDVNARNNNGDTAIMWAAAHNNSEALKLMLENPDVDVNARNNNGRTAIMWAVAYCRSEALKLMLENSDIDLDVKDNRGRGLEEMVGIIRGNTRDKSTCLEMIAVKRRSESCLEEVRNNVRPHLDSVRKEYIDKIDKNNIEIEALKERNESIGKRRRELEMEEVENNQKMVKIRKITNQLDKYLKRIDLDPDNDANPANLEALHKNLECPVCLEMMRPPVRIWMCPASHLVCEPCKERLEGRCCPTCRTGTVNFRAIMAENFARDLFSN